MHDIDDGGGFFWSRAASGHRQRLWRRLPQLLETEPNAREDDEPDEQSSRRTRFAQTRTPPRRLPPHLIVGARSIGPCALRRDPHRSRAAALHAACRAQLTRSVGDDVCGAFPLTSGRKASISRLARLERLGSSESSVVGCALADPSPALSSAQGSSCGRLRSRARPGQSRADVIDCLKESDGGSEAGPSANTCSAERSPSFSRSLPR